MRVGCQKAVTTYPLAPDNAFKQTSIGACIEPPKRGYGRQGIAQKTPKYRHGVMGFT